MGFLQTLHAYHLSSTPVYIYSHLQCPAVTWPQFTFFAENQCLLASGKKKKKKTHSKRWLCLTTEAFTLRLLHSLNNFLKKKRWKIRSVTRWAALQAQLIVIADSIMVVSSSSASNLYQSEIKVRQFYVFSCCLEVGIWKRLSSFLITLSSISVWIVLQRRDWVILGTRHCFSPQVRNL